jgi:hypothetical protein
MRSRFARGLLVGAVFAAVGVSGVLLAQSELQLTSRRAAVRAFDLHAREAVDLFGELQAGQQAYAAVGQGVAYWMPKVESMAAGAEKMIGDLQQSPISAGTRAPLDRAAAALADFIDADTRAREHIRRHDSLMASNVIFSVGREAARAAALEIEQARLAEHQAYDAEEAVTRRRELLILAGSASLMVLVVLLLAPIPRGRETYMGVALEEAPATPAAATPLPSTRAPAPGADAPSSSTPTSAAAPVLAAAAQLCTDFGRVTDLTGLQGLIGRVADVMDASGLVVWFGSITGADMRPVLAHGYSEQALGRMPPVRRSDENAAAAAYRTGTLQIVMSHDHRSAGAVIAPVLTSGGCIGVLSAEIQGGGEASASVQALATIFASQLASVLAATEEQRKQIDG